MIQNKLRYPSRVEVAFNSVANYKWLLFVILVSFTLCISFIRFVPALGDEGVLLHGAIRMLRGETIYVDFFEFFPPGGFFLVAGWFELFGDSFLSARLLIILTVTSIACFTYLCCQRVSGSSKIGAFIAIAWVISTQGVMTQISHHWFTTLFTMMSFYTSLVIIEKGSNSRRVQSLATGVFVGVAAMITPTRGVLALLATALAIHGARIRKRQWFAYIIGVILVPVILLMYIIYKGALIDAFADVIIYSATQYASIQWVPFGYAATWYSYPIKYLFPFTALLTICHFSYCWRTLINDKVVRACIAFSVAGFIGCFPRPDIVHIAFTVPLVCPLLANCVRRTTYLLHPNIRALSVGFILIICIPFVRVYLSYTGDILNAEKVDTPRGQVSVNGSYARVLESIARKPASDKYFFYPYMPMLPYMMAREHVSKYDLFVPYYTLPSQYQEACKSVVQSATWVVIDRNWSNLKFLKTIFPALKDSVPQEVRSFEQALDASFELVERIGSFEVRRRSDVIDKQVCLGIGLSNSRPVDEVAKNQPDKVDASARFSSL